MNILYLEYSVPGVILLYCQGSPWEGRNCGLIRLSTAIPDLIDHLCHEKSRRHECGVQKGMHAWYA